MLCFAKLTGEHNNKNTFILGIYIFKYMFLACTALTFILHRCYVVINVKALTLTNKL